MSEQIKLRITEPPTAEYKFKDAETKEEMTEVRPLEFISIGNFDVEFAPNTIITAPNRAVADRLIAEYGLVEISAEEIPNDEPENEYEKQYVAEFPSRKVFIEQQIPLETVKGLNREQLIGLKGIGEKSADAVIEFLTSSPIPPTQTVKTVEPEYDLEDRQNDGGAE